MLITCSKSLPIELDPAFHAKGVPHCHRTAVGYLEVLRFWFGGIQGTLTLEPQALEPVAV